MFSERRLTLRSGLLTLSGYDLGVLPTGDPTERGSHLSLPSVRGTLTSEEIHWNFCTVCISCRSEPTYWKTARLDMTVGTVADLSKKQTVTKLDETPIHKSVKCQGIWTRGTLSLRTLWGDVDLTERLLPTLYLPFLFAAFAPERHL